VIPNLTWESPEFTTWDALVDPEALWNLATLAGADSVRVAVQGITRVQGNRSTADVLVVGVQEAQQSLGLLQRADPLTLQLSESFVINVILGVSDSLNLSLTEVPAIFSASWVSDDLVVQLDEVWDIFNSLDLSDELSLGLVESVHSPMPVFLDLADDLLVELQDAGRMDVNIVSFTGEILAVGLLETQVHCVNDWPQDGAGAGNWQNAGSAPGDPWGKKSA
jgi:hypothetical protein